MSDFGQARPATHKNLSAAFGGLLTRNEAPTPSPTITEDEDATVETPAVTEASTTEIPSTETGPVAEAKPKKPTRRKAAAVDEVAASTPVAEISPAVIPEHSAAPSNAPEAAADDKADQPVQISLSVSLNARLTAFKKETGLSHPNILFDAIENTAEQLPELVKAKTVQLGSSTGTSLFSRPRTAVKRDAASEPKESFIIRITKQNKGVLDTLVKQVEAPNRMVLIVAAYDEYLPELPDE